ncbi:MAG: hypothetical protein AAFN77_01910 [Planctomycetota bacterium]
MLETQKTLAKTSVNLFAILLVTVCCWPMLCFGQELTPDQVDPKMAPSTRNLRGNWQAKGIGRGIYDIPKAGQRAPSFPERGTMNLLYNPPRGILVPSDRDYKKGFQLLNQAPQPYNGIGNGINGQSGQLGNTNKTALALGEIFKAFYHEADFVKAGSRLHQLESLDGLSHSFAELQKSQPVSRVIFEKQYTALQAAAYEDGCDDLVILLAGFQHYQLGHFDEAERELLRFLKRRHADTMGMKLLLKIRSEKPPQPTPIEELEDDR